MPKGVYVRTEEAKINIKKAKQISALRGEQHYNWKGGISKDKNHKNLLRKERRHRLGVSKKYNDELGVSRTDEYKRLYRKITKALSKYKGELTIKTLQLVYEDNIKKYGTLTCYLCLKPIEFKQDSLEHRTPLCRGGTNEYENLAIAHLSCNKKKHTKTEEAFRKEFC